MARHSSTTSRTDQPRLGNWLRSLRERKRLPLRVVAAAAEMDQAHLSKVELGQRLLTAQQATAIAKFYKLDPKEIEARRIAEKFRSEHANNPAVVQAIRILNEDFGIYRLRSLSKTRHIGEIDASNNTVAKTVE